MLDTVKLRLLDYEIEKQNSLSITTIFNTSGEEKNACKLFDMNDGTEIGGTKAYFNTKDLQFDIMTRGAFVKFSVPKTYHQGNNYNSVNQENTKEVFSHIETELKENGIKTDIFNSDLSRIDMFKQIVPDEHFHNYAPIFRTINGTQKELRDYGTTFLWKNSVEQIAVYDKIKEMLHQKKDISGLPDTIRFENRLLNKRKIEQVLEFTKANELIKYYDELEPSYKASIRKNLFRLDTKEFNIAIQKEFEARFEYHFLTGGRQWLNKFIYTLGVDAVEIYGVENIVSLARTKWNNKEKQKAYRLRKKINDTIAETTLSKRCTVNKTLLTLYNELKTKLVA